MSFNRDQTHSIEQQLKPFKIQTNKKHVKIISKDQDIGNKATRVEVKYQNKIIKYLNYNHGQRANGSNRL